MKPLIPSLLFGSGVLIIIAITILGWVVIPIVIESKIEEKVRLVEGSSTWNKWKVNPVPIYLKFHFFNVTNPKALENSEKPNLVEVGPYVFEERREKFDIVVDKEADTVRYKQRLTYKFVDDMSNGTQDDILNIVNGAFLICSTVIFTRQGPDSDGKSLIELMTEAGESFVKTNVSVREVLFEGFKLPGIYEEIFILSGQDVPPQFEGNRFGYYRGKNGSNDGEYLIYAGVKDSSNFGRIISWNNKTQLDWWYPPTWREDPHPNTTYCNQINGTDGSIYPPFVKKDTILRNFLSDVCRSLYMVYKEDIEHLGVPGYKFVLPDKFFQAPAINEDNYCFCPSPKREELSGTCDGGVIRIFPCKNDGPIVTSSPHFLNADPKFRNLVDGLKPDEILHETFIQLEPNSALMLKASKKVQINIELQPLPTYTYFDNITNMLFPAFWIEGAVELDETLTDEIKSLLITPLNTLDIVKWSVLGFGCLLVGIAAVLCFV